MALYSIEETIRMNPDHLIRYAGDNDFEYADPGLFSLISFYELHTFLLVKISSFDRTALV